MTTTDPDRELPDYCPRCETEGARFGQPLLDCDGSGFGPCVCAGGDCCCHWHGTAPCRGCPECLGDPD